MFFTPKQVFTKYCHIAAAWSKAVPLPAQNQDLLPCFKLHSLGGPKKVARSSWTSFYSGKRAEGKGCSYKNIRHIYTNLYVTAIYNST